MNCSNTEKKTNYRNAEIHNTRIKKMQVKKSHIRLQKVPEGPRGTQRSKRYL